MKPTFLFDFAADSAEILARDCLAAAPATRSSFDLLLTAVKWRLSTGHGHGQLFDFLEILFLIHKKKNDRYVKIPA